MEEALQLANANTTIKPRSEKEHNVWLALDALYNDDKLPFKSLTISRVLMKRALLEDGQANRTKGDAHGIGEMKQRWAKARGIDVLADPNDSPTQSTSNSKDPLLRASILVRDQIKEALEDQYQSLLDQAEAKAEKYANESDNLRKQNSHLNNSLEQTMNKIKELEPLYKNAYEENIQLSSALKEKSHYTVQLFNTITTLRQELNQQFTSQYTALLTEKDNKIIMLEQQYTQLEKIRNSERDAFITTNEAQRTDYIKEKNALNNQILNLRKQLKDKASIAAHNKAQSVEIACLEKERDALHDQIKRLIVQIAQNQETDNTQMVDLITQHHKNHLTALNKQQNILSHVNQTLKTLSKSSAQQKKKTKVADDA